MRLKSEIWIQAYLRRCQVANIPVMLVRRGDRDAGAIFIKVCILDGRVRLLAPAPAGLDQADSERRWNVCFGGEAVTEQEADLTIMRHAEFDPDLWVIEVEDRYGRHFLDDWLA